MRSDFFRTWSPERGLQLLALACALIPMWIASSAIPRTNPVVAEVSPAAAVPLEDRDPRLKRADPCWTISAARTVDSRTNSAGYSEEPVSSLEERYALATQRFFSELDRASVDRFERGDYWSFQVGDEWLGRISQGNISAVSPAGLDGYRLAVFDRSASPDLYRLQEEVTRLREALSVRAHVQDLTEAQS